MSWSDEERAQALRLRAAGWGPSAIAMMVGKTRNAVIGMLDRAKNPTQPRPPVVRSARVPRDPKPPRLTADGRAWRSGSAPATTPAPKLEPVEEIVLDRHRTCAFIEGDPRVDPTACGEPAQLGSSYCPAHHRRCYVPWQRALPAQGSEEAAS